MIVPEHSENNYPFFRVCDKIPTQQTNKCIGDVINAKNHNNNNNNDNDNDNDNDNNNASWKV